MAQLITEESLGAWLIKCDPESNSDLPRQLDRPGTDVVTKWCVANNYRSRMMKPGDRAILWVSGNGRRMTRGIWGVGWVTGYVQDSRAGTRLAVSNEISLDIPLFHDGAELSSMELVNAGVTDLEVQVLAQGSNPSWVTREQLAKIEMLLEPWPGYVAPEEITIIDRGAGFGDALHKAVVE